MHLLVPAQQLHQPLDATDHVPKLGHVVVTLLPRKGAHELPVDEHPRHGAAHGPGQAGKGLHLRGNQGTQGQSPCQGHLFPALSAWNCSATPALNRSQCHQLAGGLSSAFQRISQSTSTLFLTLHLEFHLPNPFSLSLSPLWSPFRPCFPCGFFPGVSLIPRPPGMSR